MWHNDQYKLSHAGIPALVLGQAAVATAPRGAVNGYTCIGRAAHGMLLVAIRGVEVVATPVAPAALVRASPASAKWRFAGHTAAVGVRSPGRTAARHFAPHYDAHAVSWGHGGRIQRAEDPTGEPPKTYPKNTTYPLPLLLNVLYLVSTSA